MNIFKPIYACKCQREGTEFFEGLKVPMHICSKCKTFCGFHLFTDDSEISKEHTRASKTSVKDWDTEEWKAFCREVKTHHNYTLSKEQVYYLIFHIGNHNSRAYSIAKTSKDKNNGNGYF